VVLAAGYAAARGRAPLRNRNGVLLFAFLNTWVMNLLRDGGYRSVHAGLLQQSTQGECLSVIQAV
jgi:hypothetical protein